MFGETSSESPRMPSPWEALATPASSHQPSPLASSANLAVPSTPLRNVLDAAGTPPSSVESMKYLDEAIRANGGDVLSPSGEGFPKLVPEIEEGNVEYKLKLIAPTPARFTRLVTQLKYRLLEGGGQALYEIGVSDSGELVGLSRKDLEASLDTLDKMAGELGATVVVLKEIELPPGGVHMQAQKGGKRIVVADGKVEVLEVGFLEGGDPSNGVLLGVENGGARSRMVLRTGRKKKDKDARRKRRAAALLIGEIATTDLGLKIDGDAVPSSASSNPSGDASSPFADDDDSGLDLTATVTLKKPDEQPADVRRTSPIPMPIIKTYPYGRQPFAMARGRLSTSLSSNPENTGTSPAAARESSAAENSPTPDYTVEDFVYIPSSSASDSRSPKPTWASAEAAGKEKQKKSSSDDDDNDNDDDDDGDAFGFGLDLEIDSFTKSMDSFTAKGLAPSPHVKPSSSSRNHRPLHYTSTTASGSSSTVALDQPTSDSSAAAVAAAHLKRLKVPNQKKKAIVLPPPPSTNSAADKAAQRRSKRDARRDERRRKVNGLPLADDEAEIVPGEQVASDGASSTNGLVDQMINVHLQPPSTSQTPSPSIEEKGLVDDTEPKIIAEALVVRKLALEEAFLDYRGFALIDPTAELSTADGGDEDADGDGDGENQSPSED
ncbi:hypothetical protein FRC04_003569 [Tulasnella sp. 424]|nr:hypothetical protein FRC04_003569 [Tulasnella sp. 424]KAG8965567.1 hypothetical protein FRC05_003217 [Tulasnella sp. 425]